MPTMVTRLILSMSLVLLAAALYMPVYLIAMEGFNIRDDTRALWSTNLVCGGLLVVGWILVWRPEVRWTPARIFLTPISWIIAAIPAGVVAAFILIAEPYYDEMAAVFAAMIWAPCWIGLTALVWRETKTERRRSLKMQGLSALVCPTCGYNLMGLGESKCPECGSRFTLDQLYAAQKREAL